MYRIVSQFERPSEETVERARTSQASIAGFYAGQRQCCDPAIKPLKPDWKLGGPALTVRPEHPGDVAMAALCVKYARPGDVIVIDAGGSTDEGCWGAGLTRNAKQAGCSGVVVDGLATEGWRLYEMDFPIFARGIRTGGAHTCERPGWINVPVSCGGVTVYPGDIVLGDPDGIVILPRAEADTILRETEEFIANVMKLATSSTWMYETRHVEESLRALPNISWE